MDTDLSKSEATKSQVPLTEVPYEVKRAMFRLPMEVVRLISRSGATLVGVGAASLASVATVMDSTVPRKPGRKGSSSTGSPYLHTQ